MVDSSTSPALHLPAYLRRIGWTGATDATLSTLSGLVDAHVRHIAFENFDVLLGRGIALDLAAVQAKLVGARRGGYCFEHCTLMAAALQALGFAITTHTARSTLTAGRGAPRTHMFLVAALPEGRFVVDPGFGGLASRRPLPLADAPHDGSDTPPLNVMRRDGALWAQWVLRAGVLEEGWVSTMDVDPPVDFVMANHYTSTHPDSAFRHRLLFRAYVPGGRITVMNRDVTRWVGDVPGQPRLLPDRAALRGVVFEATGVDMPELENVRVPAVEGWV